MNLQVGIRFLLCSHLRTMVWFNLDGCEGGLGIGKEIVQLELKGLRVQGQKP